jgi:hypothetical protein
LNGNDQEYEKHLRHKTSDLSEYNSALVNRLRSRSWSVGKKLWDNFEAKTLVDEYECFICRKIHMGSKPGENIVNQKHYDCPVPTSPLTKEETKGSFWYDQWFQGKYEAEELSDLLVTKRVVDQETFYKLVGLRMAKSNSQ